MRDPAGRATMDLSYELLREASQHINVLVRELRTLDDTISEDPGSVAQLPARGTRDGSPGGADLRAVAPPAQSFASGRRR
jgi:hypothetical protein